MPGGAFRKQSCWSLCPSGRREQTPCCNSARFSRSRGARVRRHAHPGPRASSCLWGAGSKAPRSGGPSGGKGTRHVSPSFSLLFLHRVTRRGPLRARPGRPPSKGPPWEVPCALPLWRPAESLCPANSVGTPAGARTMRAGAERSLGFERSKNHSSARLTVCVVERQQQKP